MQVANQNTTSIMAATYTKWTGKKANEVTDLQAAFVLHIFQSESSKTYQEIFLSLFLTLQSITSRNDVYSKGQ